MILFAPLPVWSVDLAISDGTFVSGGMTDQWEWGTPTNVGPVGSGPCWCTNCDGPYLHDTVDWLEIALPDLTDVAEPSLVLHHWYAVRPGDRAEVEVDDGTGFVVVPPAYGYPDPAGFVGQSGAFVDSVFDLSPFGPNPIVHLQLTADETQSDAGWYLARVDLYDGDVLAPSVTVAEPPIDTQDLDQPYPVAADVVDDRAVDTVTLWYTVDGSAPASAPVAGPPYVAQIPAQGPGTTIGWWIEASDGENLGRYPAAGESTFRVYLAAPTNLTAPDDGRLVADQVELSWDPPVSPHPVVRYLVYRVGTVIPVAESAAPRAVVPLQPDQPEQFYVVAQYDAGEGDPSEVLSLDYQVPALETLDPPVGYQGEELYVAIEGQALYLLDGASSVDLGPDVDVLDLAVDDVSRAVAHVKIAPDAAIGPVDLALSGPPGSFVFHGAFDVRDGADAPSIRSIDPASIGQGESAEIALEATVPFAGVPTIGTDPDLVVTGAVELDDDRVVVPIAAGTRARVGLHTLTIDDGQRLYTADLQVDERLSHVTTGCCSTSPAPERAWVALLLAPAWRARRRARPRSSR